MFAHTEFAASIVAPDPGERGTSSGWIAPPRRGAVERAATPPAMTTTVPTSTPTTEPIIGDADFGVLCW